MNPGELTLFITSLANLVANELSDDELALLAAVTTQLGDTLATISVQRTLLSEKSHNVKSDSVAK